MEKFIEIPTVGDILKEEFFEPLGLSAYRVAKDIKVPVSRVQEILNGSRRISVDTDLRLCKYLGLSNGFFLRLQTNLELDMTLRSSRVQKDLEDIPCITNM